MTFEARLDGMPADLSTVSNQTRPIILLDDTDPPARADPETVILTCANCGAMMDERKCKLIW